MIARRHVFGTVYHASKKQTPFSVWYPGTSRLGRWANRSLKEADAFQRLVLEYGVAGRSGSEGLKEADAFQRLVSTRRTDEPLSPRVPQRSRRLSASGMTPAPRLRYRSVLPQRSRRLSASGICRSASAAASRSGGLKEADAFQRLVLFSLRIRRTALPAPQRSRRLSASGISRYDGYSNAPKSPQRSRRLSASGIRHAVRSHRVCHPASKKQTPFSVWYAPATPAPLVSRRRASKKQTPFSVWYLTDVGSSSDLFASLKEADAFQRLVSSTRRALPRAPSRLKEADAFQRLV